MNLGPRGEALIKHYEGLRLTSYDDGRGVWTVGWGHTRGVHEGMTITEAAAETLFVEDLHPANVAVNAVGRPLTQSMFDALVSLCFNVGGSAVSGRSTIGKALRVGDYIGAWRGFALWTATPGAEVGLARRRSAEMVLFWEDGRP